MSMLYTVVITCTGTFLSQYIRSDCLYISPVGLQNESYSEFNQIFLFGDSAMMTVHIHVQGVKAFR